MKSDEVRFLDAVLTNPVNVIILERMAVLDLPDFWLVSGSLFQTVWNIQTGRDPTYGIKDYDLFYFDPNDVSWEAEDSVIRECAQVFSDTGAEIQVRNQARVHLWYEKKFGASYPPLSSSKEGIDRFTTPSSMYGISALADGSMVTYAPHGFEDAFNLAVRPNPESVAVAHVYNEKSQRWKELWPELTVIPFN